MPGEVAKVSVGRQHRQIVAQTELRQQRIDRADLNAAAPASVSQFSSFCVVAPVGNQQRQRREPIEDLRPVARSGETLQKLLQNEPGSDEFLAGIDGTDQFASFDRRNRRVAPKGKRPDAGINKKAQRRERSDL